MLKQLRQDFIHALWETYRAASADMKPIEAALARRNVLAFKQDHFAVIDLPGPHTGIPYLSQIFAAIGYVEQGKDYLADKQNDFRWMCEQNSQEQIATAVLPQAVVADFRLDEMPADIREIIAKYSSLAKPTPLPEIQQLANEVAAGSPAAAQTLLTILMQYFSGRDWPLPSKHEFTRVQAFNELLAWVLIYGRRPNHFTLSVHLNNYFSDLESFHQFIENEAQLKLNSEGGVIKGGESKGIAQGSTVGITKTIALVDGEIQLPHGFVEFVWRYPRAEKIIPVLWGDYFTGFVAGNADRVIESLYSQD